MHSKLDVLRPKFRLINFNCIFWQKQQKYFIFTFLNFRKVGKFADLLNVQKPKNVLALDGDFIPWSPAPGRWGLRSQTPVPCTQNLHPQLGPEDFQMNNSA